MLDSNNYSHLSYYDSDKDHLKYARWDGLMVKTTVENNNIVGIYSSIALDSNGYSCISYKDIS